MDVQDEKQLMKIKYKYLDLQKDRIYRSQLTYQNYACLTRKVNINQKLYVELNLSHSFLLFGTLTNQ